MLDLIVDSVGWKALGALLFMGCLAAVFYCAFVRTEQLEKAVLGNLAEASNDFWGKDS